VRRHPVIANNAGHDYFSVIPDFVVNPNC